jgi:hypothetical protein
MVVAMVEDEETRHGLASPKADSDGLAPELIGDILDRVLARPGARRGGEPVSDESKGSPPADHSDDRSA